MLTDDPSYTEWQVVDMRIAKAWRIRESILQGNMPIYWDRSDRVRFDVKSFTSKSEAAVQRRQKKDKEPIPGRFYYAVPVTIDGGPLPTMEEFIEEQESKKGTTRAPAPGRAGGPH